MVNPAPRFELHQIVTVPARVSEGLQGRIVGQEFAGASRLSEAMSWYYFLAFTPTGQGFRASEDELLAWQGGNG